METTRYGGGRENAALKLGGRRKLEKRALRPVRQSWLKKLCERFTTFTASSMPVENGPLPCSASLMALNA